MIGVEPPVTPKSKRSKLLLFDLDWTLIYTGGAGVRALNSAFKRQFGIGEAMKKISPDGKTDPAICREMIKVHMAREPEQAEIDKLCQGYLDHLALEIPDSPGYRILPGISELLQTLLPMDHYLMGLGTGNLEEGARIKLARADFMKYFRFGGYGSDAEHRPDVLRIGVQRGEKRIGHSFLPRDVLVIGDNIRDVQAGQAIGAKTIAVASGPMSLEELAAAKPDHLFKDLSDTKAVLHVFAL